MPKVALVHTLRHGKDVQVGRLEFADGDVHWAGESKIIKGIILATPTRDAETGELYALEDNAELWFEHLPTTYTGAYLRIEVPGRVEKAGYSDDQPRVPAGSPEGGEWAGGGNTGKGAGTKNPPIKSWREPPAPKSSGSGKTGGYSATGKTNTQIGDLVEKAVTKLGLNNLHPGERTGRLDVRWDHSGWAFELKAVTTASSEYKIKMKESERAEKTAYAKAHGLRAGVMIAVTDVKKGEAHVYWREGIGNYRLSQQFNYMGTVSLKGG